MSLIHKAVKVHFACDAKLNCASEFEESVEAARSFLDHLQGRENPVFDRLIKLHRYKNKLILIQRYIKLYRK